MRALPFQLPENFLLVIRSMSLTSGICSSLDPDFNMWDAVEPYAGAAPARRARQRRAGVREGGAVGRRIVARLPQRLDALADRIEEGASSRTPRLEQRVAGSSARPGGSSRRSSSSACSSAASCSGPTSPCVGHRADSRVGAALLHALFAGVGGRRGPGA